MTFEDFINEYQNKFVEKEDPSALNQCLDLAFAYCDFLGIDRATIRHPKAYQVWTEPLDITLDCFNFIPNTPNGLPHKGDLVVWSQGYGGNGHIGIANGRSDTSSFDCFEQNDPVSSPAHTKTYSYDFILGWLRPKGLDPYVAVLKTDFEQMRAKLDKYDPMAANGYETLNDVRKALEAATTHHSEPQAQLVELPKYTEFSLLGRTFWLLT